MRVPARRVAIVAAVIAVAACGPAEPPSSATATPAPTSGASTATALPSPPLDPPITLDEPPRANLLAGNGGPVAGDLGSYVIGEKGSDSPWLPGEPVTVPADSRMTIRLEQGIAIGPWQARMTEASDAEGLNALPFGSGAGDISLTAPRAGAWTLAVTLEFAGFDGEATYYWRVSVEEP